MKTAGMLFLILAIANISAYPVHAGIRCENDIIAVGYSPSEVMIKLNCCGEVLGKDIVSRETVSKITVADTKEEKTGEMVKKEIVTEIWYIRVKERGGVYCYPLSFEEGRLKSIGNWNSCD